MWKYFTGVTQPSNGKRKTPEEKLERGRQYDASKRVRKFQESWKSTWPWLYHEIETDTGQSIMFCRVCRENPDSSDPASSFVIGCKNLKTDTIEGHHQSAKHRAAIKSEAGQKAAAGSTPADKILKDLNKNEFERLEKLFLTTHALVKKARPYTDFKWQCELDKAKQVDIGRTYINDKYCRTFTSFIAESERIKLEQKLKNCKFYSIMSDGTTDSAVKEVEIVYLRQANKGIVNTDFIGLAEMEKANAENISEGILKCCTEQLNLDQKTLLSKLVGFGSDGASVMLGCKSGVAKRIGKKQSELLELETPVLQAVHCFNHRLELSYKDVLKEILYHDKFQQWLENVYQFYHGSALNRSMLKRSCSSVGVTFLVPPRVGGTRWLPHTRKALEVVWTIYPALVQHFQQLQVTNTLTSGDRVRDDTKAKSKGFLDFMLTQRFILYGHFLTDVILALSKLSLQFQDRDWSPAGAVEAAIDNVCHKLASYKDSTSDGPYFRRVSNMATSAEDANMFHGFEIRKEPRLRDETVRHEAFTKDKHSLINGLENALHRRFSDCSEGVIGALSFAQLKTWPEQETPDFGNSMVFTLLDHYAPVLRQAGVNLEEAEDEWVTLRHRIFSTTTFTERCTPQLRPSWETLNLQHQDCPNILALVDLALTIPASNAECERGFSLMKVIKSDWRNRLSNASLTDIMRIVLQTKPIGSYDPSDAIYLWLRGGKVSRRPHICPYGSRNSSANGPSDEDTSDNSDTDSTV